MKFRYNGSYNPVKREVGSLERGDEFILASTIKMENPPVFRICVGNLDKLSVLDEALSILVPIDKNYDFTPVYKISRQDEIEFVIK